MSDSQTSEDERVRFKPSFFAPQWLVDEVTEALVCAYTPDDLMSKVIEEFARDSRDRMEARMRLTYG